MRFENTIRAIPGLDISRLGSVCSVMLQKQSSSEEIQLFRGNSTAFTTEQDHGRTDAPGRKVRMNVEDTREVVVAARLTFIQIDQLRFTEFGISSQDSMKWGSETSLGGGGDETTQTREGLNLHCGLPPPKAKASSTRAKLNCFITHH